MSENERMYIVTMPDGSRWEVPVHVIALHRARYYADEFDGNTARSLEEDTLPLFSAHEREIADWAKGNMNWEDVRDIARRLPSEEVEPDFQEGWVNGDWTVSGC